MFIAVETAQGAAVTVNLAYITHITQFESHYPGAGSVIHFTSGRLVQVTSTVEELIELIEADPHRSPTSAFPGL